MSVFQSYPLKRSTPVFQAWAVLLSLSLVACAAETDAAQIAIDDEAAIPRRLNTRSDYSRCDAVIAAMATRPEFASEVLVLEETVNDEGVSAREQLCVLVSETLQNTQFSFATTFGGNGTGAIRVLVGALVGLSAVVVLVSREFLFALVGGMLFDSNIQSPVELAIGDINATFETVYAEAMQQLPLEAKGDLEMRKDWLRDGIKIWISTYANSDEAREEPRGSKYCYAVVYGDSAVARDTVDYAVSNCVTDDARCTAAQRMAIDNLRLLQSATPSVGIFYNACTQRLGFFRPSL